MTQKRLIAGGSCLLLLAIYIMSEPYPAARVLILAGWLLIGIAGLRQAIKETKAGRSQQHMPASPPALPPR
jgi:hypothetical protein